MNYLVVIFGALLVLGSSLFHSTLVCCTGLLMISIGTTGSTIVTAIENLKK